SAGFVRYPGCRTETGPADVLKGEYRMKRFQLRRTFVHIAVRSIVAVVLPAWAPSFAGAAPRIDDPNLRHFAMVGIVKGQTARLNVVNVPQSGEVSPGPCRVTLSFHDSQGNVMVEDPSLLLPGKATFLDFMIEDPNLRAEIRAQVTVQPGPCRLAVIPSMEIFDNATGKSTIF